MNDNNKEEPFLLSDYQMHQVRKLTKQLEDIRDNIRAKNNWTETVLAAFNYPMQECHKFVYHVSGFNLKRIYDILFGRGLVNSKDRGIFYNITEYLYYTDAYSIFKLGKVRDKRHVSYFHMRSFYLSDQLNGIARHDATGVPMWGPQGQYKRRFGFIPLSVTYEIDTRGFEEGINVYGDPTHVTVGQGTIESVDGLQDFARYVPQNRIPSKYIRLKAISFVFPWSYPILGKMIHKVIWRRKSD